MSVLIKNMRMPRHCGECGIEWCDRWKQLIIAGMSIAKTRPSDCPLVELPPHGRLGDLDALEQMFADIDNAPFSEFDGAEPFYFADDAARIIRLTPTILEAEEGE